MKTATSSIAKKSPISGAPIKKVHIDTSIQIERFKAPDRSQVAEHALAGFRFKSTSSYAKLEFKRAWLQRLLYLYVACEKVQRDDDLMGYIDSHLGAHKRLMNKYKTTVQALQSYLHRSIKDTESLTPKERLNRIQATLRIGILSSYVLWESMITYEFNGTKCLRASEEPKRLDGGKIDVVISRCKRGQIKCAVHEFFEENKDYFLDIKQEIELLGEDASGELKDCKEAIARSEKDPAFLCDSKNCIKLRDAIIAVDGVEMDCFMANNDKEWVALSKALGKSLLNPLRKKPLDDED